MWVSEGIGTFRLVLPSPVSATGLTRRLEGDGLAAAPQGDGVVEDDGLGLDGRQIFLSFH